MTREVPLDTQPAEAAATAASEASPAAPKPAEPTGDPAKFELWKNVQQALFAVPDAFKSQLRVEGVLATDLFTFNTTLGASIEQQVVDTLNDLHEVWDPTGRWRPYRFVRQPQTFPDCVLRTTATGLPKEPLLGIELKGWYVLAKEREPSFRYKVTPAIPTEFDLLVVYPWALDSVVSGSPRLFEPWVVSARWGAEYRNWWWQHQRAAQGSRDIVLSRIRTPYPTGRRATSDHPAASDSGKNFGRLARTGAMSDFNQQLFAQTLSGISLDAWQKFFRSQAEAAEAVAEDDA